MRGAAAVVREGIVATEEVGVTRTYGRFIRENGISIALDLGDVGRSGPPGRGKRRPDAGRRGHSSAMV